MTMTSEEINKKKEFKSPWPKECANSKVHESDNNFFETFTGLVWKKENYRRRITSENEKEAKQLPPEEHNFARNTTSYKLSKKEYESLYIEVLYTIKHKIGKTSGCHLPYIRDLYQYAQEAFKVHNDDHERLLATAVQENPPILILNVSVVEARSLEAKDVDGYSDPYCMLGIVPGTRSNALEHKPYYHGHLAEGGSISSDEDPVQRANSRSGGLRKFSQVRCVSFKKKKEKTTNIEKIPVRFLRTTCVKSKTLNPVWQENMRFDLENVSTDRLHLDIWDHDDEFSVVDAAKTLNEVQGLKGLGRYFKQIAQSARSSNKESVDDFLGCLNIRLCDIPSTGESRWFDLEARSARSNVEGQIYLSLMLSTREDRGSGYNEEDNWTDLSQHKDLTGVLIDHELRKFKYEVFRWTGDLSKAATTILHQHAIQGDITELQQSLCRWMAYCRKHINQAFDWSLILRLLDDLDEKYEPNELNRDEEELISRSFTEFIEFCLSLIARQRHAYPPANKAASCRFVFLIRCLLKLYGMDIFTRCFPFKKTLVQEITHVLKKGTFDWYHKVAKNLKEKSVSSAFSQVDDNNDLTDLIELVNIVNADLAKGLHYYAPLYHKHLNIDYFSIVYKQLDGMLEGDTTERLRDAVSYKRNAHTLGMVDQVHTHTPHDAQHAANTHLEDVTADDMGVTLYELYLGLHEFCHQQQYLSSADREKLLLPQYYKLYDDHIKYWIQVSRVKANKRIKCAVQFDKNGNVDSQPVKQSTSSVDVSCCFGQIIDFWRSIDWPDNIGSYPFVSQITKDLCNGATYYADLIHSKLKASGYYDDIGQFDVTQQLCVTINNIELVRRALKPLPEALKFADIIISMEETRPEQVNEVRKTLLGAIEHTDQMMIHKIKQVVDRVADKMRPDIKKDVFHLCWAPEKSHPNEAICELLSYLDSNLLTLNTHLLSSNFKRILDSIWVEVLEEIYEVLETEEVKMDWFFARLFDSLQILQDFFHASGKGLSMGAMKNKIYLDLHWQLTLNKMLTEPVIETFYKEKIIEQQHYNNNCFGAINIRAYYNTDAEMLLIEVLNAKNLIALDPNGLSDPFVFIELSPHHLFADSNIQKTQIVKNCLNPVFDEAFEFNISRSQCEKEGACVTFTVMDHDFMLSNDFAGEAFLPLRSITRDTCTSLKDICIPLMHAARKGIQTRASAAITALNIRDWDKEAMEFVKKRRLVESQSRA